MASSQQQKAGKAKSNIIGQQEAIQEKQKTLNQLAEDDESVRQAKKSPWIHAWTDSVAGIHSLSQLTCLCDLKNDGDYKFIVADLLHNFANKNKNFNANSKVASANQRKLKVYMGTNVIYEAQVAEKPVAVATFFDQHHKPNLPVIAVAGGSQIFYFKDFAPEMRYDLPLIEFSEEETQIWTELIKLTGQQFNQNAGEEATESSQENEVQTMSSLLEKLFALRESRPQDGLSYMSARLLALESQQEQYQFINENNMFLSMSNVAGGARFCHKNFITCMISIYKGIESEKAQGLLVVGTENQDVIIIDKTGMGIAKQVKLKSVPVFMASQGCFEIDYKIFVACRNGCTYQIKNGNVSNSFKVHIESKPTGLVKLDKTLVISGMNQNLYSFYNKGRLNFTKQMPAEITDICKLEVRKQTSTQCILVALKNGEIRMFNDKYHIDTISVGETINALKFGTFGREEGCLIINTASGGLHAKVIQRQANLTGTSQRPGPPIEQDIPLNVPKKTKLFLELTQREKDQGVKMHRQFQKDLSKMRLKTAEAYLDMLSIGYAPMSYAQGGQNLRLIASYEGIGPVFKVKLELQNIGKVCLVQTKIVLNFNENVYRLRTRNPTLPLMVPQLQYKVDIEIECIDPMGAADIIKVFVFNEESTLPLITANIQMPACEQEFDL